MNFRPILFYWLPLFLYCALIFFLSSRPTVGTSHDKIVHLVAYGIMSILFARAWRQHTVFSSKIFLLAFIFATLYGVSDEIHQYFVPGRNCSGWDIIADSIGAMLGALLYVTFTRIPRFKTSN